MSREVKKASHKINNAHSDGLGLKVLAGVRLFVASFDHLIFLSCQCSPVPVEINVLTGLLAWLLLESEEQQTGLIF